MSLVARVTALASAVGSDFKALFTGKVDKVEGKELSSNDFTTVEKDQLAALVLFAEEAQLKLTDLQEQIDALNPP